MALIKNINCISPNATQLPSQGSRSDTLLTIWLHLLLAHHSTLILTSLASFRFRGSPRIYRIYHYAHSPRFYGLPKIHKPGIPFRPIASFVNSPTYAISGYLARILSPVVGNTDYTVKNSCEFADFIRDKTLNACEELVSFDVVSLFTKIPVDLAVKIAEERRKNFRTTPYFIMLAHLINYAFYSLSLNTIDNSLGN